VSEEESLERWKKRREGGVGFLNMVLCPRPRRKKKGEKRKPVNRTIVDEPTKKKSEKGKGGGG